MSEAAFFRGSFDETLNLLIEAMNSYEVTDTVAMALAPVRNEVTVSRKCVTEIGFET